MLRKIPAEWLIVLLAALFFIPFLGRVHLFDWDEINFAECAREMLITRDFGRVYINFQPFWEKPPLFFWLQAASMELFGVGDFAARFPNAICGILTLVIIFRIGKKLYNQVFGWFWVLLYGGSVLPHLYFRSGIIDPWFNLFIFIAIYFYVLYYWKRELIQHLSFTRPCWFYIFWSGFFLGLALITKGPAGIAIFGLTVLVRWALLRFRVFFGFKEIGIFLISLTLVSLVWYGYEIARNGTWFIKEFITYNFRLLSTEDAGHGGFPGYHVVVLLLGCFPASLFFILGHIRNKETTKALLDFRTHMLVLFYVVLILFSIVQSKIVHYSSMCYFPLTYVGALAAFRLYSEEIRMPAWLKWGVVLVCGLLGTVVCILPFLAQKPLFLKELLAKDPFAAANLDTHVHWTGWEWTVGLFVLGVGFISVSWFNRQKFLPGFVSLFGGSAIMVTLILWAFLGRIESISQGTAIDFFESVADEDCYVLTYNYRSYAHYYYARLRPENKPKYHDPNNLNASRDRSRDSLLLGKNTKPVYLITKINRKDGLERYPGLKPVFEKNGWSVWKKDAVK